MSHASPGKVATIKDVARRCGVHYMTVSRALHHDPRVKPETVERILNVAREMGYNFSNGDRGRRLVALRHNTRVINHVIGVFFPRNIIHDPYFAEMFDGIMAVTADAGYTLHVIPTIDSEAPEHLLSTLPPSLKRGDLDGAIFTQWSPPRTFQVLQQLRQEPHFGARPLVALMSEMAGCSSVTTDDYQGMSALMRHLLDYGHRHFMHSYWDRNTTITDTQRYSAMRDACIARELDPVQCLHFEGIHWEQSLHHRMELPVHRMLETHPEVTAIIAPNDFYARQIYTILCRDGIRVPEDISLVGFDDTLPILDSAGNNILTTVHLPLEQVGRTATHVLIERIEQDDLEPVQRILPAELVVRRSTRRV
ncbi:MAG TPA: LacI family DNA-binding transcriptional regulator [Armatimonadota bacterium]|nr:LacI family DNA-binding transcriptional regulator [Armatimonadota bacterium]